MENEQLIESIIWIFVYAGIGLVCISIVFAIVVRRIFKKAESDFRLRIESPYKYPEPMHTISKFTDKKETKK